MNPFKKYETDQQMERNGVPVVFDEMTFFCRRAGGANRAYRLACTVALLEEGMRERLNGTDEVAQLDAQNEIELYAFVEAVLVGWEGVEGRDDQPLPFTKENARDLFTTCTEVWNTVRVMAQSRDSYRRKAVEEAGAALGNSSDGVENTVKT